MDSPPRTRESGTSSFRTGASTQLTIEGTWDESIPLHQIHQGIVDYLVTKLDNMKQKYKDAKNESSRPRIMNKLIKYRMQYQKYVCVTQDVLGNCDNFLKTRRDTPESRIAFIRNVQEYFTHAKDFVKLDMNMKKINPKLLQQVSPSNRDSPNTFKHKRELWKTLNDIIEKENGHCISNTGIGKTFRSRYIQQSQFNFYKFPDTWITLLPNIIREVLYNLGLPEERWLVVILYIYSKHCNAMYIHQGYCSACLYPIINPRDVQQNGGKLYCHSCHKEIDWTYYINQRTLKNFFSTFHRLEIEKLQDTLSTELYRRSDEWDISKGCFEPLLVEYFGDVSPPSDEDLETEVDVPNSEEEDEDNLETEEEPKPEKPKATPSKPRPTKRTTKKESVKKRLQYVFPDYKTTMEEVKKRLMDLFKGEEPDLSDVKTLKETYNAYLTEIYNFEGVDVPRLPKGLLISVDKYVTHHFMAPPKDQVLTMELTDKGTKPGTSRKMIYEALEELNYSAFLPHVSFIANKLWGYEFPNFDGKRLNIIVDCIVQRQVFSKLSSIYGRRSNLNQQLVLMRITEKYGYKWNEEDFKIFFTEGTKNRQLEILKEVMGVMYA